MSEELKPESQFTEQERQLYDLMSEISEDCWCAGWIGGNEYSLWNAITTGDLTFGQGEIDRLMLAKVAALSVETGKWIIWRDDADGLDRHDTSEWGPYAISLAEWSRRRAASTIPASEAEDEAAFGSMEEFAEAADLVAEVVNSVTNGEALGAILKYRKKVRGAALASTRTASKQAIVTAGDRMARWLYGLSQSEKMPESWRSTCAELAQAWKGVAGTEVNAGAAAGGNTCKESVTSSSAKNGTKSPETRMDTGFRTDVNSAAEVDVEAERKRFESWMVNEAKIIVGSTDPYPAGLERDYWRVWQAAARTQADAWEDAPCA